MAKAELKYKTKTEARQTQERKQDVIDSEIERLYQELGHVPNNREIVDASKRKDAPLHRYFEWDDSLAAQHWRDTQAHQMLMACRFVVELQENGRKRRVQVRKFVLIKQNEPLRFRNEALSESDARSAFLARATGELRSWCARFADLEELASVRKAILDSISGQRSHGGARPGRALLGSSGPRNAGTAWRGWARHGVARQRRRGAAWQGRARRGLARRGIASQARHGVAGRGVARPGKASHRRHGPARRGEARRGKASQARLGTAGRGGAWRGKTRQARSTHTSAVNTKGTDHMSKKSKDVRAASEGASVQGFTIEPARKAWVGVEIGGQSYIQNAFNQKAIEQMLRKHMGLTVQREKKSPRDVIQGAIIRNESESICAPPVAIKCAMLTASAALKTFERKKTLLKTSLFVVGGSVPLTYEKLVPRLDMVRTSGMTRVPDVRFRPQFVNWKMRFLIEYSDTILQPQSVIDLLQRAGSVGIGEWRPEKNGTHGTFDVLRAVTDPEEVAEVKAACSVPIKTIEIPEWALDSDIDFSKLAVALTSPEGDGESAEDAERVAE